MLVSVRDRDREIEREREREIDRERERERERERLCLREMTRHPTGIIFNIHLTQYES